MTDKFPLLSITWRKAPGKALAKAGRVAQGVACTKECSTKSIERGKELLSLVLALTNYNLF